MTTMKKMLCMVLAFALLLTFGCKKDDKTETQDVPETPDNTVEAPPMEQPHHLFHSSVSPSAVPAVCL